MVVARVRADPEETPAGMTGMTPLARHVARASLPSAGQILAALSPDRFDGEAYDNALPERQKTTLY